MNSMIRVYIYIYIYLKEIRSRHVSEKCYRRGRANKIKVTYTMPNANLTKGIEQFGPETFI